MKTTIKQLSWHIEFERYGTVPQIWWSIQRWFK